MPQTLLVSEWCSSEPLRAVDDLYNLVQTDLAFSARRSEKLKTSRVSTLRNQGTAKPRTAGAEIAWTRHARDPGARCSCAAALIFDSESLWPAIGTVDLTVFPA